MALVRQSVLQAVRKHDVPLALSLVDTDRDLSLADEEGNTALHYAAAFGYLELVARLISAGAPLNRRNNELLTPLIYAVEYDLRDVATTLWKQQRQSMLGGRIAQIPFVVELCDIALSWTRPLGAATSGFFQKDSPLQFGHHPRAREIGGEVHESGGIANMRSVHYLVRSTLGVRAAVELSACWHGVGTWLH